jgi:hypothetical protein
MENSDDDRNSVSYVYYASDKQYRAHCTVTSDEYSILSVNDPVTVYILRSRPWVSHFGPVTNGAINHELSRFWAVNTIGLTIFGLMAFAYERFIRTQRLLLGSGVLALADIVSVKSNGDGAPYTMTCTYSANGQDVKRSFSVPHGNLGVKTAGGTVPILYNPEKPRQSMLCEQVIAVVFGP